MLFFFLFFSSVLAAQVSPGKAKVSAEGILDRYRQAIGADAKLDSLKTAEITASVTMISGHSNGFDVHFWRKFPDEDVLELDTRSHGIARSGHNEGKEFRDKDVTGVRSINYVSVVSMEEALLAVTDKHWKDRFSNIDLIGVTNFGRHKSYVLGLTLKEGNRQVWYLDSDSYLLTRIDMAEEWKPPSGNGPKAVYKVEVNFSDYSDAAGLKLPRTISFDASSWVVRLELAHIKFDVPINERVFAPRQ